MAEHVILERRGRVAVLTLSRPERRNALNAAMWSALEAVLDELEPALPRALVVTGAPPAFCAGMDINPDNPQIAEKFAAIQAGDRGPIAALLERLCRAIHRLVHLPIPVIAAVNGAAYGGGAELAAQCDLRVLDPAATICFSEVNLGLMPDWGGGVALTRLLGPARAAHLILTGRKVGAEEAERLGLAQVVSPPGACLEAALALAQEIAAKGPRSVRSALEVIRRTPGLPLKEALAFEFERAADLIASGECVHGIMAFMNKAKPEFPDIA